MHHILQRRATRSQSAAPTSPTVTAATLLEAVRSATDGLHGPGEACSLVYLAVDDYRATVHRHGLEAGELLLQKVSAVLAEACDAGESMARLRPTEFGVFLPGSDAEDAARFVRRIQSALEGVSVGVVSWSGSGASVQSVAQLAYQAMYEAQRAPAGEYRHVLIEDGQARAYADVAESSFAAEEVSQPPEDARVLAASAVGAEPAWKSSADWMQG